MTIEADKQLLDAMDKRIQAIKTAAQELQYLCAGIQAVERNADRVLASVKMLEINVTDLLDIL